MVAVELGEADSSAQFPKFGALLLSNIESFPIELFGGLRLPVLQQQFALEPIQLRFQPALLSPFNDLQSIIDQTQSLFYLPCELTRRSKKD